MTRIDAAAFARLHHLRAPRIAWLFGAGASAAAGVPTANQMTWAFKAMLYATEKGVPRSALDLSDPMVRVRIQSHFASDPRCPMDGSDEEYSFYFERAYARPEDRRAFIGEAIALGRPGYGHFAVATLIALKKVGVMWTTNFDRLIEDAAATLLGTTRELTTASIDNASVARDALRDERLPLYGKLHGDFQSDRLKNISAELQAQDSILRDALSVAAGRFGLAVVGYSGRDVSVIEALRAGLQHAAPYPAGLYWFVRGNQPPIQPVVEFIEQAQRAGVEAHMIPFETFDELFGLLLVPFAVPADLAAKLQSLRPPSRKQAFRTPPAGRGFPVLRLNALVVEEFPRTARLVDCDVGPTRDVRQAIESAGAAVLAHRRRDGVIAFGSDAEVEQAFRSKSLRSLSLAPLNPHGGSPSDLALLYDALLRALARGRAFRAMRRLLFMDSSRLQAEEFTELRHVVGPLTWTIPDTALEWAEGVELRLESRSGALWLVFSPMTWATRSEDEITKQLRTDFLRSRASERYNRKTDELLRVWSHILAATNPLHAFGLGEQPGIDASFKLDPRTAFSRFGGR